jgi:hypothetical protein
VITVVDWQLQLSAGSEQHAPDSALGVGSPQHALVGEVADDGADEQQLLVPAPGGLAF